MKLTEAIQAAKEQDAPIRLSTQPDFVLKVFEGKFYFLDGNDFDFKDNPSFDKGSPVALTLDQIISDDWEFEKRIWVGKRERKNVVEVTVNGSVKDKP